MPPGRILRIPALRSFGIGRPITILPMSRFYSRPALTISTDRAARKPFLPFGSRRSFSSDPPSPTDLDAPKTLSERLKYLIKSYGWYALGMYAILTVIDFTIAFGLVYVVGAEHVSRLTHYLRGLMSDIFHRPHPTQGQDGEQSGSEGIYAMLILAYGIHKIVFLPFRVALTAAFTPRMVGWLGRRGWLYGENAKKAAAQMQQRREMKQAAKVAAREGR
jgi:hypothetical protein